MSFTFNNSGPEINEVWSCTECVYYSTKHHFHDTGEMRGCPLCSAPAKKIGEQEEQTGMPSYRYQSLLSHLEERVSGVGSSTVSSLQERFEDGDEFVSAAKQAYEEQDWDALACVNGVGESTARNIALGLAEKRGWEDGLAESEFSFS